MLRQVSTSNQLLAKLHRGPTPPLCRTSLLHHITLYHNNRQHGSREIGPYAECCPYWYISPPFGLVAAAASSSDRQDFDFNCARVLTASQGKQYQFFSAESYLAAQICAAARPLVVEYRIASECAIARRFNANSRAMAVQMILHESWRWQIEAGANNDMGSDLTLVKSTAAREPHDERSRRSRETTAPTTSSCRELSRN